MIITKSTILKVMFPIFLMSSGISFIFNLIILGYPIYRIKLIIDYVFKRLNSKKKQIVATDQEYVLEAVLWLRYMSVFSIWTVLEFYMYNIPLISILGVVSPYIKLSVLGFTILQFHLEKRLDFPLYDSILDLSDYNIDLDKDELKNLFTQTKFYILNNINFQKLLK